MLFHKVKNYKFASGKTLGKIFGFMSLWIVVTASYAADEAEANFSEPSIVGITYNTIQNDQIELVFTMSSEVAELPSVKTSMNPAFIEVDFDVKSFSKAIENTEVNHANIKNITLNKTVDNVIATINLDKLEVFDVAKKGKDFSITFNAGKSAEVLESVGSSPQKYMNNVSGIDFRLNDLKQGQVLIDLDSSMVAVDVNDKSGKINIEFHNTRITEDFLYKLDVTDFGTIVTSIETFKADRNALIVVEVGDHFDFSHQQEGSLFTLTVSEQAEKKPAYLGESEDFTGKNISLDFQDIPVRTVLQIIANYNEFNLITSDTVTGNITLRLDGVPWDQALDMILKVKGLDKRMQGNILMIAPSDELSARETKDLEAQLQVEKLAPLYSDYIQINYAVAGEFAELIKNEDTSILSDRGSVSVDERTNTLLIRDTEKSIEDIKRMVSILDIPVRQVIIEARMVTVKDNLNEELGIRWGATSAGTDSTTSGRLEGADAANAGGVPAIADRLNVNLPVVNPAGAIAFQVARLADGTILDLELTAMEKESKGEIIASPRITTANQKEAYIEQGVEIPYQEAASSGATATQFKKAVLSLTVTPHITPDDKIILDLVITQDTISEVQSGSAPAIDTQRIGTQVLVDNGETIVLGGIYQQSIISQVSKVPVLGDIPYVGFFFRTSSDFNEKKELLIFVTPRIVTEKF
jgi:type IV pilus assembly protein PilQ